LISPKLLKGMHTLIQKEVIGGNIIKTHNSSMKFDKIMTSVELGENFAFIIQALDLL
jgi:hypothetical protein